MESKKKESRRRVGGRQHVTVHSHFWRGVAKVAVSNQAKDPGFVCVCVGKLNEQIVYLAKDPGTRKDCCL